ncbi:Phosphate metabolism transcription protein [Rhizina undulata]
MHFGKTLQVSIYPPWRDHYIDYAKLKKLLREGSDSDAEGSPSDGEFDPKEWTEHDESVFVEELINVQLEKVYNFQRQKSEEFKDRTTACEKRLEKLVSPSEEPISEEERQKILKETLEELDQITHEINELEKFSRVNFTGFLKAAKKHDRRPRGARAGAVKGKGKGKGKGKDGGSGEYKVRPLLQVRLSALEFNREDYSPLLYRLSSMFAFVRQNMNKEPNETTETRTSSISGTQDFGAQGAGSRKYTSHKFWIHPDNVLEVKTFVLRRLPVLIYNPVPSKEIETHRRDPTINSLYFDSPKFCLYNDKVSKAKNAASLRLRWYGQLSQKPDIWLERKTLQSGNDDMEGAIEERIPLKEKYVKDFIDGTYSMEKTIQKMRDRKSKAEEDVEKYQALVKDLQDFIKEKDLQPMLRAVYTRAAFQIPGDDRIRVSLDTDLALIREDALDTERPCRDPDDWHRKDIDEAEMEYPFKALRKGEISRFPYALLEIKVIDSALHGRSREWVNDLINSHLVKEEPRFSKFVHGVAVLFEDYVNTFPFWLSELDKDIRQDPKQAWEAEQERAKKQMEDETKVGSFKPGSMLAQQLGGRGTPPRVGSANMITTANGEQDTRKLSKIAQESEGKSIENATAEEEQSSDEESDRDTAKPSDALARLRNLFPTFSSSRYGRAHAKYPEIALPPGVKKPGTLLMHSGPVQVEAKVWLANQRTFIKWQHVSILLASLSLALYNAAGKQNPIAKWLAVVYTGIAIFAAGWGWAMYMHRSRLIRERSGKDFDNVVGPVVVCFALAIALALNFGFKYRAAMQERNGHNVTVMEEIFTLDREVTKLTQQGGH